MPACPHCGAEIDGTTLAPGSPQVCPECGGALAADHESADLSGIAGSPADATLALGDSADSISLGGSSLADSGDAHSEAPSELTLDSGAAPSAPPPESIDRFDATIAVGGDVGRPDDSDDFDFDLDEDEVAEELDPEPTGEPSTSLDATIDLCHWAREDDPGADDLRAEGATIDLGGAPRGNLLDPPLVDEPVADSAEAESSEHDSRTEVTLPTDSDRASSVSGSDQASGEAGSAEASNEPTLAFDSERKTSGVNTPQPLDITGLASGGTLPAGPLADGRASGSLRPGDSQLVGEESVRLRAFRLADPVEGNDPLAIDYAIEGEAGKGGMGVVYKAKQQSLKRPVAIKQIKPDLGASDSDLNKFVSEAVITGQLEHPNIAPVHDLGLAADGLPFYAMKFVEGEDWEDSIKEKSEEENLNILIQVAQAIAFAHSRGVLHRDLKPGNVRLGSFGEVLVMDWGLAARLDGGAIQPAGTPIYMPPETALEYLDHARGKVVGGKRVESSRRRIPAGTYCDIYLLGALLFKIVTGRAPHRGKTTFECLRNAARNEIVKTRRRSELLDIAYKAMATEPEDRHATAIEFIDALRAYQSHAQSIQIAKRASKDLREAGRLVEEGDNDPTTLYALFSSAQNGYQNALELWDGNRKAARRLKRTKRMYAESAYAGGDFDLALSLLDESVEGVEELRVSVAESQKSRRTRLAWFRTLQYATAAALMLALAFIGYSVYARLDALSARADRDAARSEAQQVTARAEAEVEASRKKVAEAEKEASDKITAADRQAEQAIEQANIAAGEAINEANAEAASRIRNAETRIAAADKKVERLGREANAQAYLAALGRVRATLLDRGAYAAWKELRKVDPEVAAQGADDPAWRVLTAAVAWQTEATELVGERPDGARRPTRLARSGDGRWLVAAASEGPNKVALSFYQADQPEKPTRELAVDAQPGPVVVDRVGRYAAIAGPRLSVIDTRTGRLLPTPESAGEPTCIAFHPTRPELLVGTTDTAIETWDLSGAKPELVDRDDRWHQTAITAVGYSPDGARRVSADRSGRIVAWRGVGGAWTERVTFRRDGAGSPRVTALAVSDDRAGRLAVGCDDGAVYEVLGWFGGEPAAKPDGNYARVVSERLAARHAGPVTAVAYAEEEGVILSAGGDTLLVQDAPASGERHAARRVERRYHDVAVLACLPGAAGQAFSADEMGRVLAWRLDAAAERVAYEPRHHARRQAGVAALRMSGVGPERSLVVADNDGFVRRWDDLENPGDADLRFTGHADHRGFRAWRLEGPTPRIVTVASDNRAVVWRESDGLPERTLGLGGRTVVAFDAERGRLLAASDGRAIADGPQAIAFSLREGTSEPLWDDRARVASITPLRGAEPGAATVAVGLRDGQVYLWGPRSGRVELVDSSGRPHWRPVVAMTHDEASGRLLSADRGGLVASWDLRDSREVVETRLSGPEPITRLIGWSDQQVLVARRHDDGVRLTRLNDRLESLPAPSLSMAGLVDVAVGADDNLSGLARARGGASLLSWSPEGWSVDATAPWRATGIAVTGGGRLVWGPGTAQLWTGRNGQTVAAARIVSRAPVTSLVGSTDVGSVGLTRDGVFDPRDGRLSRLPVEGRISAACDAAAPQETLLAVTDPQGMTRIESWDVDGGRRLRRLTQPLDGTVWAIAPLGEGCVAAVDDGLLVVGRAGESQRIALPEGVGPARSLASNSSGERVAVVTTGGDLLLAEKREAGRWSVAPTDRKRVDSAAFTRDGDRLLVGSAGGRVEMLAVSDRAGGVYATRRLLSFAGHGNRVTHLRVEPAPRGSGATLLSGDASGLVLTRSLP